MVKRMLAIGCVVLAVAGCEKTTTSRVTDGYGEMGVQLVTLEDGTKCAVAVGYLKGAISCGWK